MKKSTSFDLFVNFYATAFALLLILVGLGGPMLAVQQGAGGMSVFAIATGLLVAWLLPIQVNSVTGTLRRMSANAR